MVRAKVKKIFQIYRSALLTKGSAITTSIFFSAWTANSAKRLLMTYSPGLTSGSIVMLDMMIFFFPKVEWKLEEAQYLFTLLTGAEAKNRRDKRTLMINTRMRPTVTTLFNMLPVPKLCPGLPIYMIILYFSLLYLLHSHKLPNCNLVMCCLLCTVFLLTLLMWNS